MISAAARKRAIFIFCVMFPVLLIAEYTGNNSVGLAAITAGVSSGISVILFPEEQGKKDDDQQGE